MSAARFEVIRDDLLMANPLVIRDVGPWDQHLSVTNDAERVVEELVQRGKLPPGRRLFYYDSEGQLDEIVVRAGRFAGFRPVEVGGGWNDG